MAVVLVAGSSVLVAAGVAGAGRGQESVVTRPAPVVTRVARIGALRVELTYRRTHLQLYEARLQVFRSAQRLVDDRLLPL